MRCNEVAGKHRGDLTFVVQCDVQQEARPRAQSDVPHFLPDGIPTSHAKGGIGIADVLCAVIANNGVEPCHTWHNAFGAAAEAGKKVWLDKPCDDSHVCLDKMAVEKRR